MPAPGHIRLLTHVLTLLVLAGCGHTRLKAAEPLTLRVALYPYVPDARGLFFELEAAFEKAHPGVNVELVETPALTWHYYSGGLSKVQADVYEIDTVMLSDMIAAKKLQPYAKPPVGPYAEMALQAVQRDGQTWAVPHWMCGNFLFHRAHDTELAQARTWAEVNAVLAGRKRAMFVDFKGKSTLGEWYLTLLSQFEGAKAAEAKIMSGAPLDSRVVELMSQILQSCPAGHCRNDALHDRVGYYARAFVRGEADAYVGYSETLHAAMSEVQQSCGPTDACLRPEELAVRALPQATIDDAATGIGWVDGLALDAGLKGRKLAVARAFIEFLASDEAYQMVLEPEWGESPRYLIPARRMNVKGAPLYPQLYRAHEGRATGQSAGLNDALRALGKQLDCALPISRRDTKTLEECRKGR
ncbi:MAG: extracellular solute-binding protein [Bradymonadia bacterium]